MKYKIVEVPWINYEVQDEEGNVAYNDRGHNLFETKEEAEKLIEVLGKFIKNEGQYKEENCECGLTDDETWSEAVFDRFGCTCEEDKQ